MGKALYRKYRSKSLSEIVGQEHITKTLSHSLKNGSISHAYLFTGPHGVGKTSIARILAHEVNGFPYDEKTTAVDIIEIDAASNRRIDEMRDLRDKVAIAPVQGKYKVYIIDEVHMLTREAFNALLKTLEEPPEHVIFILATTEAHKLPETIISRTQRHTFKPIETSQVVGHLRHIADSEKLTISDDALELIAQHGKGSFRDSISLLDQIAQQGTKVTTEDAHALLGIPPITAIDELLDTTSQGPQEIFTALHELRDQGYEATTIAHILLERLRQRLSESVQLGRSLMPYMQSLLNIPASAHPYEALEVVLLDMYFAQAGDSDNPPAPAPDKIMSTTVVQQTVAEPVPPIKQKAVPSAEMQPEPKKTPTQTPKGDFDWEACLLAIKKRYNTLYGVLRMANSEVKDDELHLTFKFAFHQKKIADTKNRQLISDIINEQCGQTLTVVTHIDVDAKAPQTAIAPPDKKIETNNSHAATISNIFGGAEVLE